MNSTSSIVISDSTDTIERAKIFYDYKPTPPSQLTCQL